MAEKALIKETIKVGGMSCAACAAAIERGLNKKDGVNEAVVNLATEKVTVEYDQGQISQ